MNAGRKINILGRSCAQLSEMKKKKKCRYWALTVGNGEDGGGGGGGSIASVKNMIRVDRRCVDE